MCGGTELVAVFDIIHISGSVSRVTETSENEIEILYISDKL